jgi:hypothetical protein
MTVPLFTEGVDIGLNKPKGVIVDLAMEGEGACIVEESGEETLQAVIKGRRRMMSIFRYIGCIEMGKNIVNRP